MTLDSWLVARLARELQVLLAGARIAEVQSGRRTLDVASYRRGATTLLRARLDPQSPLVCVTDDLERASESGPGGFAGGVAPLLRGSVIDTIQAVPNDRILSVDVISRSSFGVPARHRITLELEPRRANVLVLRPTQEGAWQILAAEAQFSGSEGNRSIAVGEPYDAPPPRLPKLDRPRFAAAVTAALEASADLHARLLARALSELDPACTGPLGRDVVERVFVGGVWSGRIDSTADGAESLSEALVAEWAALRAHVELAAADPQAPIHAYRRGTETVACHLVPLAWAPGEHVEVSSLNGLLVDELARLDEQRSSPTHAGLRAKLETMLARCGDEAVGLRAALDRAQHADSLRAAGDAIYANLRDVEPGSTSFVAPDGTRVALDPLLTAKQNAAEYFRRYRKAHSGVRHIEARLEGLRANKAHWEQLLWELERAEAEPSLRSMIYADVAAAIASRRSGGSAAVRPVGVGSRSRPSSRPSKRQPQGERPGTKRTTIELPGGASAYVGRSPKDNDRLTFSVARADDYWFHARGIPGAHVILRAAHAGEQPSDEQIAAAAALAAGASRASAAAKVEVDYTQRKHVRRQSKGRPGLVWYTDFKTVLVTPKRA